MIQQIRIQNFRSLKDITLDLQQVNLLIGPNNSGKTNVLKGLKLLAEYVKDKKIGIADKIFKRYLFAGRKKNSSDPISITVKISIGEHAFLFKIELYSGTISKSAFFLMEQNESPNIDIRKLVTTTEKFFPPIAKDRNDIFVTVDADKVYSNARRQFENIFGNVILYQPDPAKFIHSTSVASSTVLDSDASNIVTFLFTLSQNHKKKFQQLEDDLKRCVGDIVSISTPPDPDQNGRLKLKFFDAYDNDYWADEVSEGVLYFLALLCIIHQPDPPKLLLLEEPEKGIHPRRIREVMDFIFDLAQEKDIQVIMTTHDTYVVDQFADIPEAVFVFDKKDGATEVKNLQKDIIEPANKQNEANSLPPTQYTQSLGEHWAAGFLGGVPR